MNIAISIEHPAWAYQFKAIIKQLEEEDNAVLVLAVEKDGDTKLLDDFDIEYQLMAKGTGRNIIEKGLLFLKLCFTYSAVVKRNHIDILIGRASPMMAVAAFINKIPHIIFEDTEVSHFSLQFCKFFSKWIITPEAFLTNLGKKQKRYRIYKELFYLGKDFKPNPEIITKSGMDIQEKYVIVRFVSWNASHDVGMRGLSARQKKEFIEELARFVRVYISSESELDADLEQYRLPVAYNQIHNALYYATLVISEGASMASEAAVLGTYAFYLNSIESGTTNEQEKKYGLLRVLHNPDTRYEEAMREAKELIADTDLKEKCREKREKLLESMGEPNEIFMGMIKNEV